MSITHDLLRTLDLAKPPPIDRHLLPAAQSPDVVLVPATSLEYAQTAILNCEDWSGPLTLSQYLEREVVLQDVDLTKNGRITGWSLTSNSLPTKPDGSRPILASCESIPISAVVARQGEVATVQAHGIASVYTRPEHRGRGYAGRMMAELGKRLESWQSDGPNNQFSVLFSDIGKQFYAKFGYKSVESNHIHVAPLTQAEYDATKASFPVVRDLTATDLQSLPTIKYNEVHLRELSVQEPSKTFIAVRPDLAHFEWHHAREGYQIQALGKPHNNIKGAVHPETGLAIIWCRKYATAPKDWQLSILHTVIPPNLPVSEDNQLAFAALILRAQVEASRSEMAAGVEIWDPSELVVSSAQKLRKQEESKIEIITRDQEHLCSLRWTGHETDDPVWITKQKYAWC